MNEARKSKIILQYAGREVMAIDATSFLLYAGLCVSYLAMICLRYSYHYAIWGGLWALALVLSGAGVYKAFNNKKNYSKRAIVIIIISGVLSLISIPFQWRWNKQSDRTKRIQWTGIQIQLIDQVIQSRIQDESNRIIGSSDKRSTSTIISDVLKGRFTSSDGWGRPFQIKEPGVHHPESYDVFSAGPDGIYGNSDDIGNW